MRSEDIIAKARERTGLEHFDSESFREGLEVAADAIDAHPHRSARGRAYLEELHIGNLAKRLRVADWARRHPGLTDAPIERPVFVIGMPRTGTTMASYLLAADRRRRSLLRWESEHPVPPPTTKTLYDNPVIDKLRATEDLSGAATHYEAPDGPTECAFITAHDFKSLFIEAMSVSSAFEDFVLSTDYSTVYRYHRLYLQVLQSQAPGIWNLKMPAHSVFIDGLLKVYPDARVIWTHRDPYQSAGSLFSLISGAHQLTLSKPDMAHIRATYPEQLRQHVARPMAVMDRSASDPFYHLMYSAMMRDPIGEMRKLYAWLGDTLTPEAEAAMKSWLAANPQGRFGKHSYTLDQFDITKDQLTPYFEDYLARFDIEMEG